MNKNFKKISWMGNSLEPEPAEFTEMYRFPYYYKTVMNLSCIFCLFPYWISFEGTSVIYHEIPLHRALCYCVHAALVIYAWPQFLGQIKDMSLLKQPTAIFSLFSAVLWACNTIVLTRKYLFKQQRIRKLLEMPRKELDCKAKAVQLAIVLFFFASIVFLNLHQFVNHDGSLRSYETVVQSSCYQTLSFFGKNPDILDTVSAGRPLSLYDLLLCSFFTGLVKLQEVVYHLTLLLCFIASIASHEVASSAFNFVKKSETNSLIRGLGLFAATKQVIAKLNRFTKSFILLEFATYVSYMSITFVDILDTRFFPFKPFLICLTTICSWSFYLAAESFEKMKKTQQRLKRRLSCLEYDTTYSSLRHEVDNLPEEIGLTGGSFFTITYPLLGETFGVFLTYCIIMIQMKASRIPQQ